MSSLTVIAQLIPDEYRKEILETNMIASAQALASNTSMAYLFTIWKEYVEPHGDLNLACGFCLQRILDNWKGLQGELIKLEKESNLLKEV